MNANDSSPWIERFQGLSDLQVIAERSKRAAETLHDLGSISAEAAHDRMRAQFDAIFYPTSSSTGILKTLIDRAVAYSNTNYPNERHFLGRCYSPSNEEVESAPICITGLAGVGKTQLRKAFFRLLPPEQTIEVTEHGKFPMVAAQLVLVRSRKTVQEVLKSLARPGIEKTGLKGESAWLNECKQWLYQSGVCSVGLDELQFLTQSEKANTLVSQFLLAMSYLGPPVFYSCNYSLGHRLLRRPQEEQQRLLSRVHILLPDAYDSEDWTNVLKEYQLVAPEVFKFDFPTNGKEIWNLTAGNWRVTVQLLLLAHRQARRQSKKEVAIDDLIKSYHSPEFFVQRQDIEHLFTYGRSDAKKRKDLICPFNIQTSQGEKYFQALQDSRGGVVAQKVLEAAMTADERRSLNRIENMLEPVKALPKTNNVLKLKTAHPKTLEALKAAAQKFKDEL